MPLIKWNLFIKLLTFLLNNLDRRGQKQKNSTEIPKILFSKLIYWIWNLSDGNFIQNMVQKQKQKNEKKRKELKFIIDKFWMEV